ncbi:MAG: hypothetical protein Q8941_05075 [Bacteroidota bacterium]|nr:hypothetical protein [Bacteroidota bacterium]
MKKVLVNSAFLIAGLLSLTAAISQEDNKKEEPKFKKIKTYTKSYSLSGNDKVSLSNQFGEMKITTWEKNEVKVDVTITCKSDVEERAQKILDHISIVDSKGASGVYFKTKFDDDKEVGKDDKGKHFNHNESMEINYAVYLPAGNPLNAENQFGKMIIPDYKGEAELASKFGSLEAGRISNAKKIDVEFGEANIAQVNGGKLAIRFSSGTVNKLSGDVKTDLEFSQVKLNIDNDIKSLELHNSYSTVYLDLNKNLSATYDISTSHGSFSNKTVFTIKEKEKEDSRYGPRFNSEFSGTSGSGAAKLKIESSFGEIIAGHDLQVDLKKKEKDKSKTRRV